MQRANSAVLRQISQRFPDAVGQLVYGNDCFLIADQRQFDPALDVCAEQADAFQVFHASVFQQSVDLLKLRLNKAEHRVHQMVLFFDLCALALQRVFRLNQFVFFGQLSVDFHELRPDAVDLGYILHPVHAPVLYRRALKPRVAGQ